MPVVHVAVAAIVNCENEVLIALRHPSQHQGGLWEFPGGKLEAEETVYDALQREIYEELGIRILQAEPLIKISHNYSDKLVLLDVWLVKSFAGEPQGHEGQPLKWSVIDSLVSTDFPEANRPIIMNLKKLISDNQSDQNPSA